MMSNDKNSYHHGDLKNALIQASIEIVAREGVYGLSLRKAAKRAGVSHNAPYAHFENKQALIAAIALHGHTKIHSIIMEVAERYANDPLRQLANLAWEYVQFGLNNPALYKITFSGLIENEKNYPVFVQVSQDSMTFIQNLVTECQKTGILSTSEYEVELIADSVWGLMHGFVSLMIEGQVSTELIKRNPLKDMVIAVLQQIIRVPIDKRLLES